MKSASKIMLIPIGIATGLGVLFASGMGTRLLYGRRPDAVPDRVESVGPLELLTHTTFYTTGITTGNLGWGRTEHYSLRYHGEPFRFEGKAGEGSDKTAFYETFNSLVTFPAPEPVALINVGDPMNTSFFYLLREVDGQVHAEFLIEGRGGVSVDWLDPDPKSAPKVRDITLHRGHLEGGRFLLVGGQCVLDTQTLTKYVFPRPEGARPNPFKPTLTISPDHYSLVRYGYREGDDAEVLIVMDFVDGTSEIVPIDAKLTRHQPRNWEELDEAWANHYFEWIHLPGAHDRLAARRDVVPMSYRGELLLAQNSGGTFVLKLAKPGLLEPVAKLIESEFQGIRSPYPEKYSASYYGVVAGVTMTINGRIIYVCADTRRADGDKDYERIAVWTMDSHDTNLLKQIGERINVMLETRAYDNQFDY